jgi:hypothetical protein
VKVAIGKAHLGRPFLFRLCIGFGLGAYLKFNPGLSTGDIGPHRPVALLKMLNVVATPHLVLPGKLAKS